MNAAPLLLCASASILVALGGIHLLYTFRGHKLDPRDAAVRDAMEHAHPVITRQTTVWRATKGFNASHSLGLMSFGLVYAHLALTRFDVLRDAPFLLGLGLAVLLGYLALAHRYFFSVPFRAMGLASVLYALGWALS